MKRALVSLVGPAVALAMASCSGSPSSPKDSGQTACIEPTHKNVRVTVAAGDWVYTETLSAPVPSDTTTNFYGSATLSSPALITGVNPGDTIQVQVLFADRLGVRGAVSPEISVTLAGGNQGGLTAASNYTAVEVNGTWVLSVGNGGVYGSNPGVVDGYWTHLNSSVTPVGAVLSCLTVTLRVPTSIGGTAIAANSTITIGFVRWLAILNGDHRGEPPPIYTL